MPLRSYTLAERILTERRRMDRLLMGLVWLGVATFSLADGRWFYLLATTLAVTVNLLAARQAKEVHIHRHFVNAGVLVASAVLLLEIFTTNVPVILAFGHYLILLQICKLFQHKTNRDYVQILALNSLLIVAASITDNSLWLAALTVLYLVLLAHTAMVFTLKRGLDATAQQRLITESQPLEAERLAWSVTRAWPRGAMRRRLALVLTTILATGILIFLLSPRSGVPSADLPVGQATAVSGFEGNSVRLDDTTGPIYQSNTVLMHVSLRTPQGKVAAAGEEAYLRGATFNCYSQSRWVHQVPPGVPAHPSFPPVTQDLLSGALEQDVSMSPSLLPNLFVVQPAVGVTSNVGRCYFEPDLSARLQSDQRPLHNVRYNAVSLRQPLSDRAARFLDAVADHFGQEQLSDPSQGVEAPESVRELAENWCEDLLRERQDHPNREEELNVQIARRIADRLRSQYQYTLDLSAADPSRDGVEDFLLYTRRGHCEYFASAMAVMCRMLNVPARLAAGFVLDEYDPSNGYYIVRGRDAHAWVEVFSPGKGWTLFDPTPPGGRQMHGEVWGKSFRRFWADLQFLWFEKVIGYDASARLAAWDWIKTRWQIAWSAIVRSFRDSLTSGRVDRAFVRLAVIVAGIGTVLEGVLVLRWLRRRARRRRNAAWRFWSGVELRFLRHLLKLLKRNGLEPAPGQTLREFLSSAAPRLGDNRHVAEELVDLYYATRWGLQVPTKEELRLAEQRVHELARRLTR